MKTYDAIIVPGLKLREDGTAEEELLGRLREAEACWRRGQSERIAVCGGATGGKNVSEARVMAEALLAMGVPREAILMEDSSRITYENMKNVLSLLPPGKGKLLVVTSDYHLPRARLILRKLGRRSDGVKYKTPGGPQKRRRRRLEFYATVDYLIGWGANDEARPAWAMRLKRFLQRRNGAI